MSQYGSKPQENDYTGQQYGTPGYDQANTGGAYYGWSPSPYVQYGAPTGNGGMAMLQTPRGLFTLGSVGVRFGASVLDSIFSTVLAAIPFGLAFAFGQYYSSAYYNDSYYRSYDSGFHQPGLFALFMTLAVLVYIGYYVWGTARGATWGKRLVGLRVIRADGQVPGFGGAMLREVVGRFILGWFTPFYIYSLVDAIFVLSDRRKQALHDKIATTFVVKA